MVPVDHLSFFRYPECGAAVAYSSSGADRVVCDNGHGFTAGGGIIDFVRSRHETALDSIDYDQFYAVSEEKSEHQFRIFREVAGDMLPANVPRLLEIGAGTGGFSMSLLKNLAVGEAVLTDVSLKMLSQCRQRLAEFAPRDSLNTCFATYSAVEKCLADGVFNLVFGGFVLHHVLDFPSLFADLHRAMTVGGVAIFIEPAQPFHRGLIGVGADVVRDFSPGASGSDRKDLEQFAGWLNTVHYNIKPGFIDLLQVVRGRVQCG